MIGSYPSICNEDEYDARLDQIDALITCIEEYEARVHPIGEPTLWGRVCFRWDQAWKWQIAPAIFGGLLVWLVTRR